MTFDYISDLHTDFYCPEYSITHKKFYTQIEKYALSLLPETRSETLIIAGDIGHRFEQDSHLLKLLKSLYTNVIITTGNHDKYLVTASIRSKYAHNSFAREQELKDFCASNEIHFLDGTSVTIDNTIFAGAPMSWDKTHYELLCESPVSDYEVVEYYKRYLNDYRNISCGTPPYTVPLPYGYGQTVFYGDFDPIDYFKKQYASLLAIEKADVVVSHYAPLLHPSMPEKFKDHLGTSFYYFDGSDIIQKLKPKAWVFGHTHTKAIDLVDGTYYLCNPKGYPKENPLTKITSFTIGEN